MSREEDLIRSTAQAIASTVREVPPLRLEPAPGQRPSTARPPRRPRDRRSRTRHWAAWAAPLTAAVIVVALAVGLVAARDVISDGKTQPSPTASGPGGAPRYYVALRQFTGDWEGDTARNEIVVGDSLTGTTLATYVPPSGTTYQSVTADASDRTFVVLAVRSSNGHFGDSSTPRATLTGSWLKVTVTPGAKYPVTLHRLPVPSWSWSSEHTVKDFIVPSPGEVFATALSGSGQELAVAEIPPGIPPADVSRAEDWQQVRVYSVASGRSLSGWTEESPTAAFGHDDGTTPPLTWIDGDRELDLTMITGQNSTNEMGAVRRVYAAGSQAPGGTVIWSGPLTNGADDGCFAAHYWPPLISADGKTVSCLNFQDLSRVRTQFSFVTDPIPGTGAAVKSTVAFRVTGKEPAVIKNLADSDYASVLWTDASGGTLIGVWKFPGKTPHVGVMSHGTFTPLKVPASLAELPVGQFAW